jgi:hypothetical protein
LEVRGLGDQLIDTFEQATTRLSEANPPLVPVVGEAAELLSILVFSQSNQAAF